MSDASVLWSTSPIVHSFWELIEFSCLWSSLRSHFLGQKEPGFLSLLFMQWRHSLEDAGGLYKLHNRRHRDQGSDVCTALGTRPSASWEHSLEDLCALCGWDGVWRQVASYLSVFCSQPLPTIFFKKMQRKPNPQEVSNMTGECTQTEREDLILWDLWVWGEVG